MTKDEAMKIADEAGTKTASDRNYGWVAGSGEDLITAVSRAYNRSFLFSLKANGWEVKAAGPACLPKCWRPSKELAAAVGSYKRIKSDLAEFDGDRRGIVAALVASESRIVAALNLNPDGDEDGDRDFALVRACAELIVAMLAAEGEDQ
jgi:hypothetical protein